MSHLESVAIPGPICWPILTGPTLIAILGRSGWSSSRREPSDAECAHARPPFRRGSRFGVCAGPTRVSDAQRVLTRGEADAVLLALGWAEGGLRAFTRLYAAAPSVPIVVVVDDDEQAIAAEAVRLRAQDYLLREELTSEHIARAIVLRNRAQPAARRAARSVADGSAHRALQPPRVRSCSAEAHLRLLRRTRRRSLLSVRRSRRPQADQRRTRPRGRRPRDRRARRA